MGRGTHGGMGERGNENSRHHSLADNLPDVTKTYPLKEGYFGTPGDGGYRVRHIESNTPVKTGEDFFERMTVGAIKRWPIIGKGKCAELSDHSVITFRHVSSSDGTPAADIKIIQQGLVKPQKIHFVKKEK